MVIVKLTPGLEAKCDAFGERRIEMYAREKERAAYSVDGGEKNLFIQQEGRKAECAACIYFNLGTPLEVLDWSDTPDGGTDLVFKGTRIDVKGTKPGGQYLLWPKGKNKAYRGKAFDVMVLALGLGQKWIMKGWITKTDFWERKLTAGPNHKLTVGTWHVEAGSLNRMITFPGLDTRIRPELIAA